MNAILFMVAVVVMTMFGDYLLKLASMRPSAFTSPEFVAGAAIYALSAVGWVYAMRHMSLAAIGVYYSMLMLILLAAMGVLFFGEKLAARELLGIGFACVSIVLLARLH
jgi:drug/metabolite transporter (DMT)-like permease